MANFSCGVNEISVNTFDGRTVDDAVNGLSAVLSIPEDATILVNGEEVTDDYVIESDDSIEFVRRAGTKG